MQKLNQTIAKQKGAVLILMAFVIGLGVLAYLLYAFDPARLRLEQDKKTMQTLNAAKQALIAWAVSHPNVPGMMPWPDRNTDLDFAPYPNAYDGRSDCVTTTFSRPYLLGQLPWRAQSNPCTLPHTGLGTEFIDAQGNKLWYAVSRNLVHDYENGETPIINPGMINTPHAITPYLRQGGTESYPWLQVLDRNGSLVSDRVAAVIIAPGNPIGTQNRSNPAANPSEFLDTFRIGAATYNNSNYSVIDEDFVMGEDSHNVSANDPTFVRPYNFNDKLVYITIDELMEALEKRVLEETKDKLIKYYAANGYYPFAAGLGSTTNPNQCVQGNYRGLLPVIAAMAHTCIYTAASRVSSCNFSVVNSTSFTRNAGSFVATGASANSPTGACSVSPLTPNVCTCNGLGTCKRASGATQFSCDSCGVCTATVAGTNTFNTTGNINVSTLGCTNTTAQASCSGSDGSFSLAACSDLPIPIAPAVNGLPAWFLANKWQNYITYSISSNCTSSGANCASAMPQLTVGSRSGVRAIVASPGAEINAMPYTASKAGAQSVRPSCDIRDYLDASENTNQAVANGLQDNLYEPSQNKGQSYNDQIVIVAP